MKCKKCCYFGEAETDTFIDVPTMQSEGGSGYKESIK